MDDIVEVVVDLALEIVGEGLFAVTEYTKGGKKRTRSRQRLLRALRVCLWLPLAYAFMLGCVLGATVVKILCGAGLLLLVAAAVLLFSWRARRQGSASREKTRGGQRPSPRFRFPEYPVCLPAVSAAR